ncbi:DUF2730 family protein [Brucella anthropi]|uniref:DUF2730 family protein n=1 Tax=Brucella anthropi TaxID=529 RepID=UPI000F6911D4|nr:DUF2730 family protein [Brucella anthropi]RRY17901.1 DUF2730 family protein [Brucella anthropi]
MSPAEIAAYVSLALGIIALGGHVKGWINSGEKQLKDDVSSHTGKLTDHDRRIQTLENEIKHLPDRDSQHRMEIQLAEMNGRFAALEEKLRPIAATSERLHELLMEQAKR